MIFVAENLPESMAVWHTRLLDVIADTYGAKYPSPDTAAASGDMYSIGRTVTQYIQALRCAYRVVRDPALLAEADRVMTVAYGSLHDYDSDGYLEWVYASGTDAGMDRTMCWVTIAEHVAWLSHHQSDYAESYARWLDVLEHHCIPQGIIPDDLMHIESRTLLWCHVMGELGYTPPYNLRNRIDDVFMPHMLTDDGGAFVWDHRRLLPGVRSDKLGAQPAVYAVGETLGSILELYLCNVSPFCGEAYMQKWAKTVAQNVMNGNGNTLSTDVTGGAGFEWINPILNPAYAMEFGRYTRHVSPAFAAFDSSGDIDGYNDYAWGDGGTAVHLPAYALVAAGIRYINANAGARPWIVV